MWIYDSLVRRDENNVEEFKILTSYMPHQMYTYLESKNKDTDDALVMPLNHYYLVFFETLLNFLR